MEPLWTGAGHAMVGDSAEEIGIRLSLLTILVLWPLLWTLAMHPARPQRAWPDQPRDLAVHPGPRRSPERHT